MVSGDHAFVERIYVSRFATTALGLVIHVSGVLSDADGPVVATIVNEASEEVGSGVAYNSETGHYEYLLTPPMTGVPGLYLVYWDYSVNGVSVTEETYFEVGKSSPTYDAMGDELKEVVEQVWLKFADLFDSPLGGPHLQTYIQSNFGRERVAQLVRSGVARLNVISQPITTYTIDGKGGPIFPVARWGGLLETIAYVEVIKHLRRSYVEQPDVIGVNLARLDRRDYMSRWGEILRDEQGDLDTMIEQFKVSHMGLGAVSALVSGGVYGKLGPIRHIGLLAMRPSYIPKYY